MNNGLYDMIFKRKSFHLFRNIGNEQITENELKSIENAFNKFKPLVEDIKVKIKKYNNVIFWSYDLKNYRKSNWWGGENSKCKYK